MKRTFFVLSLLLVFGFTAATVSAAGGQPVLEVEAEQLHAGDVDAGSSVEGVFRFLNLSQQPIHILRAKPG